MRSIFNTLTYLKPERAFKSDVFPAPDGPSIAVRRPDFNSPQASLSIVFVTVLPGTRGEYILNEFPIRYIVYPS